MRFLVLFSVVLGYAAAGFAPLAYQANSGDLQAAAIDAKVSRQDHARLLKEGQARAAEKAYWDSLSHKQNLVAAAQNHAAAIDEATAARSAYNSGYPGYAGYAPLAYGARLGYHGLGYHGYY